MPRGDKAGWLAEKSAMATAPPLKPQVGFLLSESKTTLELWPYRKSSEDRPSHQQENQIWEGSVVKVKAEGR